MKYNFSELTLVRHGESQLSVEDTGIGLTERGREQARRAGTWLVSHLGIASYDQFLVSPYGRTVETAVELGLPNPRWELEPLLTERSWGFDNKGRVEKRDSINENASSSGADPFHAAHRGGESEAQVVTRVRTVLNSLVGRRVLLVTSGEVMWITRAHLEGRDELSSAREGQPNGWITLGDHPQDRELNAIDFAHILHYGYDHATGSLQVTSICPWKVTEANEYTIETLLTNDALAERFDAVQTTLVTE